MIKFSKVVDYTKVVGGTTVNKTIEHLNDPLAKAVAVVSGVVTGLKTEGEIGTKVQKGVTEAVGGYIAGAVIDGVANGIVAGVTKHIEDKKAAEQIIVDDDEKVKDAKVVNINKED